MSRYRGFTLIEVMVVILIVAILAAVVIPIMRGRIDSAKWSEGRAMAGAIKNAIKAYYAERGAGAPAPSFTALGFGPGDLDGRYFKYSQGSFTWTSSYEGEPEPVLEYTITITSQQVIVPPALFLTKDGFSEMP